MFCFYVLTCHGNSEWNAAVTSALFWIQETRHIVAAIVQHVTYTEFLPMLLGKETVQKYDLMPESEVWSSHVWVSHTVAWSGSSLSNLWSFVQGYWNGYDPDADATVPSAFATAAFRFGHSLLPSVLERWSPNHVRIGQ